MGRRCSVKACTSLKEKPDTSLFKVPVLNYDAWNEIITKVNGCDKRKIQYVCVEHFTDEDLITTYAIPKDVENFIGKRDRCALKKGAVPSVFKCVPINKNNAAKCIPTLPAGAVKPVQPENQSFYKPKFIENNLVSNEACTTILSPRQEMLESFNKILLPIGWMLYSDGNSILMYKPIKTVQNCIRMVIEKQIVFELDTLNVFYYVHQKRRSPDILGLKQLTYPLDVSEVTKTVQMFECLRICAGGPSIIDFPDITVKKTHLENTIWRHDDCPVVLHSTKRCKQCKSLIRYFPVCRKRSLMKKTKRDEQNMMSKKQKVAIDTNISNIL